jgi:hypothetical protein
MLMLDYVATHVDASHAAFHVDAILCRYAC